MRKQRMAFRDQARETPREFVSGETHWYLGRRYRLRVIEGLGRHGVRLASGSILEMQCPPGASVHQRGAIMDRWYRRHLQARVPVFIDGWAGKLRVEVADWRIRRMKTKWGSASQRTGRLWINLELMKKPERAIDYVVLHELLHLIERHHGERFHSLLDRHMPNWRFVGPRWARCH